jgi:peptide/nickel transport system permease protein
MANEAAVDIRSEPLGAVPSRPAWWAILGRNPRSIAAALILVLMLTLALAADFAAPYGYREQHRGSEHAAPGTTHRMGTDDLGRDVFSRVMYGARVSLVVGLCATVLALSVGVLVGLASGYFGGWIDHVLMRFTDTVAAFPSLLLAVAITAVYDRPNQETWEKMAILVVALGVVGWTSMARVIRAQVLSLREQDFVAAAQALGSSHQRIMFRHILPNCLSPILVLATLSVGGNILGEAGLSFLGLGVQAPFPSWGGMLADALGHLHKAWWMVVFPGGCIVLTVLSFNLLGDGLRDALDPRAAK